MNVRFVLAVLLAPLLGVSAAMAQTDNYALETANSVNWNINWSSDVTAAGAAISQPNFSTSGWLGGLVPGTAFVGAINSGSEGAGFDPNYGGNIYNLFTTNSSGQPSSSKYDQNFWYRTQFTVPSAFNGKTVWLNFDGINKSGDVYFNGTYLGSLYGMMQRGKFNITSLIKTGQPNALAILAYVDTNWPMQNYSSPSYMSSGGWDWMPYVPGRDSGVTDHVYLTDSQGATLIDPWIRTQLNSTTQAKLSFSVGVQNPGTTAFTGTVTGLIQPGNVQFSTPVSIAAGATTTVSMTSASFPQLVINNPLLWWPNGYGAPNLYSCQVQVTSSGGTLAEQKTFNFGIRQYTYSTTGGVLHIICNGTPIFVKGGDWGMSEYLLRCRGAEYATKLQFHNDMHMNMIRNWEGSTTDHEFYDACDQYGIMVWDDFWMNSLLGDPSNLTGFNNNVIEKVKRFRNHPCIAVWCGMNEGNPDTTLTGYYTNAIATYDGNDRLYQANSHAGNLSGSGPWQLQAPSVFFANGGNEIEGDDWGFRTEMGTPVFPNYESFALFIPPADLWPANPDNDAMWQDHFWGSPSPNANTDSYTSAVNSRYGTATGIQDYCKKAQMVNIETNKAMFEGFQDNMWNDAAGLMIWMSQPAYPSMIWQTYDYYYDLNGAYWGVKKACEPVHIQWNPNTSMVKVINTSGASLNNVTAQATVYNKDGTKVPGMSYSATLATVPSNTATPALLCNLNPANLALGAHVTVSSTDNSSDGGANATDGSTGTRWSSAYSDPQWIYVDLGTAHSIQQVILYWETAYGKSYQIQVSNNASTWTTVYSTTNGQGGTETINFTPTTARYVRMYGTARGTQYGYSLWEFQVDGTPSPTLSDVHFIKLALTDSTGALLSDNFYWRGTTDLVYTGLTTMASPALTISTSTETANGQTTVTAQVSNPTSSPAIAVAVHVQCLRDTDNSRILPALMNENYFSLLQGESKTVTITFDSTLLDGANPVVTAQAYNEPIAAVVGTPNLVRVASIQAHAGTNYPIALALTGTPGVECRQINETLQLVYTFDRAVVSGDAHVIDGDGDVENVSFNGHTMTVNLTGVTNAQEITVQVSNLNATAGSASVTLGVLLGDINGDGAVNAQDVTIDRNAVESVAGTSGFNPNTDINLDGAVNAQDVTIVRNAVESSIPDF